MPRVEPPHQSGDRVLRDYEIQELIGFGGHAFVYRACRSADGQEVAIKVIPEQGRLTNVRERAKREARALVRLDHPHIVKVITGGEAKGITYIVMEMMHGKVLRDVLHDVRRLSVHEALSVAAQVAEGMVAAHRLNVIHRDLKPENVFVLKDNQVKILDFGIAKFLGYGYESTQRDLVHGTVTYMSPEQLQGFGVTDKSDVYALGTMLWEMVVGHPPVVHGVQEISLMAISHRQLTYVAPSLDEIHPEVPAYVARLVRRSLAKQAHQRETSEQFLASLHQVLDRLGQETDPRLVLDRNLLTADVSPALTPAPNTSRIIANAPTRSGGTPQGQVGPHGTEVMSPSNPSPVQAFPTVLAVPLFHPGASSDMTRIPIPKQAPARAKQPNLEPHPSERQSATAGSWDSGSAPVEQSMSITSSAVWVAPLVPRWLLGAGALVVVTAVLFLLPKQLTSSSRPGDLLGIAHSSGKAIAPSARPALERPNAKAVASEAPSEMVTTAPTTLVSRTARSETAAPVAASRKPPKTSRSRAKIKTTEPGPKPTANSRSWIEVGRERQPLWVGRPIHSGAEPREAEKSSSPPKTAPGAAPQRNSNVEQLVFQ